MTPLQILTRQNDTLARLVEKELTAHRQGRHEFRSRCEIRWRLLGVSERMQDKHANTLAAK